MIFLLAHLLEAIAYFIFFVSLTLWAWRDKRGVIKILTGYYVICVLLIAKAYMYVGTKGSNIYIYSFLCLLSSFVLGAYFYKVLIGKWARIFVLIFCTLSGFYYLFANVIQEGLRYFDSLAFVLLAFGIVVLSMMYIIQLLRDVKEEPLSMNFDFWFVSSQLIYYIGSFVIFLSFGYLTKQIIGDPSNQGLARTLTWLWALHNVLLFLSSLLTTGGILWILSRRK
jgi:hypothetical protein